MVLNIIMRICCIVEEEFSQGEQKARAEKDGGF